ncbi:unnamed protein product, partial [Candida parapsilosis]
MYAALFRDLYNGTLGKNQGYKYANQ